MTKLLDQAIAEVRKLPLERQDEAAELLLSLARLDPASLHLTAEQAAEVERRLAKPDETARHDDVRAYFRRPAA